MSGEPLADARMTIDGARLGPRIERLRIRHLHLLDQVERCGSLTAAAARMGMSQPGATKLLHELEDAFGTELFERGARGGRLTRAGLGALARLRVALGALGAARDALATTDALPLLRIGILPLVGIDALGRVVATLEADDAVPRLIVRQGTVERLLAMLLDGEVDCVVGALSPEMPPAVLRRLRVVRLWEQRLVVVASVGNPLVRRRTVSLEEAREQSWVLSSPESANRRVVDRLFLRAGVAPPVARIEVDSFHVALGLVAGSERLLAVVPEEAYRRNRSTVRRLRIVEAFQANAIVLITPADVPALPAAVLVEQHFRRYARRRARDAAPDLASP